MDSLNQFVQSSALRKRKNKKSGDSISNNRGHESKDDEVILGSTMSPGKETRISPRGAGGNCSRSPKSSKGKKVFNLKTGQMLQKGMLAGAFSQRSKNKKVKEFDSKYDRSDGSSGPKAATNSSTNNIQRQISTLRINTNNVVAD
jgi:hypothetical protein